MWKVRVEEEEEGGVGLGVVESLSGHLSPGVQNQSCARRKLGQINPQPQKAEKWARPDPDSSVFSRGFSGTARNLHWNKEKIRIRHHLSQRGKSPELLCTFESSSPISLISCTFQVFHSAPGDKRFYKMTVQIERTEITTSDKRDAKLFSRR